MKGSENAEKESFRLPVLSDVQEAEVNVAKEFFRKLVGDKLFDAFRTVNANAFDFEAPLNAFSGVCAPRNDFASTSLAEPPLIESLANLPVDVCPVFVHQLGGHNLFARRFLAQSRDSMPPSRFLRALMGHFSPI